MHEKDIKLDFHDLRIMPSLWTNIESRKEINPFYLVDETKEFLPIFTAPMDTVIDDENYNLFLKSKIHCVLPRLSSNTFQVGRYSSESYFKAMGLDEFINQYIRVDEMTRCFNTQQKHYVLIDIANGHMKKLHNAIKTAKEMYGKDLTIMAGNVANPYTFKELSDAGADYVRIGIGNGNACLTTKQTTVGFPMASLIMECKKIAMTLENPAKIIADGGMKDYSDIIMALSLGADYVMVGSLLNKCLESCGDTYLFDFIKINQYSNFTRWAFKKGWKITKRFRGMSTKEVQKKLGNKTIKTSEGIVTKRRVEYTLDKWVENFEDYLRSTMSYSDASDLLEFIGKAETIKISDKAYQRFDK